MPVKVVQIDIHSPVSITGLSGYEAVEIFFRNGRDLVGRARIPCLCDVLSLKTILPFINDLPAPLPFPPIKDPLPGVTVAICTYNRIDELAMTLRSLEQMEYPADEILVVDNACQEEVSQLIKNEFPSIHYLKEPRKGLNFARNRAMAVAANEIIAFLDDDTLADPLWVRSLAESFATHPQAGSVTGPVLPLELETEAQDIFEQNGGFCRGFKRKVIPRDRRRRLGIRLPLVAEATDAGTGCNMAFRTKILKRVGGFDPALDTGATLPGGGDLEILYRIPRAGHELVYEPRAIILHRHRRDNDGLLRQLTGHQRAFIAFLVKVITRDRGLYRLEALLFLMWRFLKYGFRMVRQMMKPGSIPFHLQVRVFVAGLIGLGSYRASLRRIRIQTWQAGGRYPLFKGQLSEFWRYREMVWNLTIRDLKVKYKRSWLGFIWTLLNPIVIILVLIVVFTHVVRLPIPHYWAFLVSGYFAFNFFTQVLNGSVQAAIANAYLTRSAYFPQEALLVSSAIARLIEFMGEMTIVLLLLTFFHHQAIPESFITTLVLIPILFFLTLGICFPLVALAIYFQDMVQVIPLATMVLFYVSPVFYQVGMVPEWLQTVFLLNPLAAILNLFHTALYQGRMPDGSYLFTLLIFSIAVSLGGYIFFNLKKRDFAEIV